MSAAADKNGGLLAVDWGTSSFRLSVIDAAGELQHQVNADCGVAQMPREQLLSFLHSEIAKLPENVQALPVIICGMAGSTIGLQNVPYRPCPTDPQQLADSLTPLDDSDLNAFIVPGLCARSTPGERSEDGELEVMRGEETQIAGWLAQATEKELQSSWLCLPGTHAKWVEIKRGRVQTFRTAMTGELYALLSKHSVLVQGEQEFSDQAFESGLAASGDTLSFNLFTTRTRVLDQRLSPRHSAAYLSGLLIGSEIRGQLEALENISGVHLIGDGRITDLYHRALAQQDIRGHRHDGAGLALQGLQQLYLRSSKND